MQDFISMATQQLGISEQGAKSATGGLLSMLQKNTDAGDFSKLTGMLPGAGDLLKQFGGSGGAAAPASGGGRLGALGGALGGMLGGNKGGGGGLGNIASMAAGVLGGNSGAGQLAGLMGLLGNSGISADKAGGFLNLFMTYVKGKGGEQVLGSLLGKMPELKQLMG